MRLASYLIDGAASYGVVTDSGIADLGDALGKRWPTLRHLLAAGGLAQAAAKAKRARRLDPAAVTFLPVVPDAHHVVCVGLNYKAHVEEAGQQWPEHPALFFRVLSALVGHEAPLVRPRVSEQFDFEGELAVVIGRPARHIAIGDALSCVAGYTCFNDGSVRDYQKHSVSAGKNFDRSGSVGAWLTTADEIPDPQALTLVTRVNDREVQRSGTDRMIYPVPEIIAYVSRFLQLLPGDIVATGTPEGVGSKRQPPLWLRPGDRVEVDIDGVGKLCNPVIAES